MRVLVIEDEVALAANVKKALESLPSFAVDVTHDGVSGAHLATTEDYDAVVLDLMLPERHGLSVLRGLRTAGSETPVLILTARASPDDVIAGLDAGADDYLAKPFEMGVLVARLKALLRRSKGRPNPVLRVADLEIDTRSHAVRRGGETVELPSLQYRLLEYLAFNEDRVVSKSELLEHLYDYDGERFSNVIEVYVSSLRRLIDRGHEPKLIHTLRGQGYRLGAQRSDVAGRASPSS